MRASDFRWHWLMGALATGVFIILLVLRLGFFQPPAPAPAAGTPVKDAALSAKETWLNVMQNGRKIGYAYRRFAPAPEGYTVAETVLMRINTMGVVQAVSVDMQGSLMPDMSLSSFQFDLRSNLFRFSARGTVQGKQLTVYTGMPGAEKRVDLPLKEVPHLASGMLDAIGLEDLKPGERRVFQVFDPAAMGQRPVIITMMPDEMITVMGRSHVARKVSIDFMGAKQFAWLGKEGVVLREKGPLGFVLERVSREQALDGLSSASADLTELASIPAGWVPNHPEQLPSLRLRLTGIQPEGLFLSGGRQTFRDGHLTVEKETPPPQGQKEAPDTVNNRRFLQPAPLIQSDDPRILAQVREIVSPGDPATVRARKLVDWVYRKIEKKPVLSVPNALEILTNRVGDCNEHAVLLTALARAAGIPTQIEAGLVYQRGRFYYHAWNILYVGRWITADAVLNQFPADVTHLRLVRGDMAQQLDIMGVIGKIRIEPEEKGT